MHEFRRSVDSKPVLVHRNDLNRLDSLLRSDESDKVSVTIKFETGHEDRTATASSAEELFACSLPAWTDYLGVVETVWREHHNGPEPREL